MIIARSAENDHDVHRSQIGCRGRPPTIVRLSTGPLQTYHELTRSDRWVSYPVFAAPTMQMDSASGDTAPMADAITRRKREIIERWLDQVRKRLENRTIDAADLENGLEQYLEGISETLQKRENPVRTNGGTLWEEVAREHAATRVKLGFNISQLIEEFFILRRIIFDVAREEGLLTGDRAEAISELISAAVGAAVKSYTDARDYATRRAEAEHVAFITHELRNPLTTALLAASELTGPETRTVGASS